MPFLREVFRDAQFIFLWRDPRENVGSLMEAWRAGRWIITRRCRNGTAMVDAAAAAVAGTARRATGTVAARQWLAANDIALGDLRQLPAGSWMPVAFHDFLADPSATVRRLCVPGGGIRRSLAGPHAACAAAFALHLLPPAADKWRSKAAAIESVLPDLTDCRHLRALG